MITQTRLKELLHYDPETGVFRWMVSRSNMRDGMVAGSPDARRGHIRIKVGDRRYQAHRLAFLYMTGEWPPDQIDHINRIRHDNRWCNLRPATRQENSRNNGGKGFYWDRRKGKWHARIRVDVDGKQLSLGLFTCMLDARAAYLRARRQYFGEFA